MLCFLCLKSLGWLKFDILNQSVRCSDLESVFQRAISSLGVDEVNK
jgi:hypothetical protein